MTALSTPEHVTPHGRTLKVVRLQFINTQTFIWVPLIVLGGAWLVTLLVYLILAGAGVDGPKYGGGSQAPMWYFAVVGAYAMTLTFPFSQAMSLTRREFFLGSMIAAAVSALGLSAVFVAIGLFEQATGGYGINGYFAYLDWVWEAGALGAGFTFFVLTMLFFTVGFWFATIYKRFGPAMLTAAILASVLLLVGIAALITWQQAWPEVGAWIVESGAVGLSLWGLLLGAVLAAGSYATLRRMPA
ncbi:hypothetical protein [Microbacterium sp. KNMS]